MVPGTFLTELERGVLLLQACQKGELLESEISDNDLDCIRAVTSASNKTLTDALVLVKAIQDFPSLTEG